MADPRFFRVAGPFTVAEIATLTGAEIGGAADRDLSLTDVAPLETAGPADVTSLHNVKYLDALARSKAGAVFVAPAMLDRAPIGATLLITRNPYLAFAKTAKLFHPLAAIQAGVASTAFIDPTVILGEGVSIGHHAVIEAGAEIGAGTRIGANSFIDTGVVIGRDCLIGANITISHALIGDRVTLYPGVRVGQDGFGFAPDPTGHVKIPQLGRVLIGDDVEVGANSTIDRGAGPDTIIGAGTWIDNLVQIGHNVTIGRGCILVAQCGIAGSTKLEDFVVIGAQSGVIGHLTVGMGAQVAGKSGVMRDVAAGTVVAGIPSVSRTQWHRQTATLERMVKKKDK
jgi:UDP-3-O-[3-hydroxymyristoyl] glucosamine N-acyltransferase